MVQFTLARALPTPPGHPSGNVLIPYLRGKQVPWGRIFNIFWQSASSSTLWYSLFFFARFQPHPASPYGNVLIPYLRGELVPWGRIFKIFWQSASSSTLWYNLLWLARFQPHPATPPGMCWSHIYGDSRSFGAEFLTYSVRARLVLPFGTVYFFSRASNPTQPPPTGMCWSHIYGESRSLGAEFLTYFDRARPVLPYGTINP